MQKTVGGLNTEPCGTPGVYQPQFAWSVRHQLLDSAELCASAGKVIPVQLCRQTPPVMALQAQMKRSSALPGFTLLSVAAGLFCPQGICGVIFSLCVAWGHSGCCIKYFIFIEYLLMLCRSFYNIFLFILFSWVCVVQRCFLLLNSLY